MSEPVSESAVPIVGVRPRLRLIIGMVIGALVSFVPLPDGSTAWLHILVGFTVGACAFSLPLLYALDRMDAVQTAAALSGRDPSRSITDVTVVIAALVSLVAVGFMLLGPSPKQASGQLIQSGVTVLAIAAAWSAVQTVYSLRYARHYANAEPGCIDFNSDAPPQFRDFMYLSFTLGMTYQVSDTNLKTPDIRAIVLRHTLLSYLFGTVVIAATINLVAGLAK